MSNPQVGGDTRACLWDYRTAEVQGQGQGVAWCPEAPATHHTLLSCTGLHFSYFSTDLYSFLFLGN